MSLGDHLDEAMPMLLPMLQFTRCHACMRENMLEYMLE